MSPQLLEDFIRVQQLQNSITAQQNELAALLHNVAVAMNVVLPAENAETERDADLRGVESTEEFDKAAYPSKTVDTSIPEEKTPVSSPSLPTASPLKIADTSPSAPSKITDIPLPGANVTLIVAENGDLIVHHGGSYRICYLAPQEREFMDKLSHSGGKLDGDTATEFFRPQKDRRKKLLTTQTLERRLRSLLSAIKGKVRNQKGTIRLSFSAWEAKMF